MKTNRVLGVSGIRYLTQQSTSAFDSTVTTPALAGLQAGDLLLVVMSMTGYERTWGPITSAGMTFSPISVSASNAAIPTVYYGFVPDSSSRTVGVTTAATTAIGLIVSAYRGVSPTRPLDVLGISPAGTFAATNAFNFPSLTTTVTRAWAFTAMATNGSSVLDCTQAGWTDDYQFDNLNGQISFGFARSEIVTAGATGTVSWTIGGTARSGNYTSWALNPL